MLRLICAKIIFLIYLYGNLFRHCFLNHDYNYKMLIVLYLFFFSIPQELFLVVSRHRNLTASNVQLSRGTAFPTRLHARPAFPTRLHLHRLISLHYLSEGVSNGFFATYRVPFENPDQATRMRMSAMKSGRKCYSTFDTVKFQCFLIT